MNLLVASDSGGPRGPEQHDVHERRDVDRRRSRARRNALLLALIAVGFYVAFILLGLMKGIFRGKAMRSHRVLTIKLAGMCLAMFGFGFALVPLYDIFCEITGLGGRTSTEAQQVTENADVSRTVRVEFVGATASGAPWEFRPNAAHMDVHPGQVYETHYYAENLTGQPITGHATPSVSPGIAAKHFKKVQCFCFTSQDFAPHEGRDMQVLFMVDPELPDYLDTVTLGYTFFTLEQS